MDEYKRLNNTPCNHQIPSPSLAYTLMCMKINPMRYHILGSRKAQKACSKVYMTT